MAFSAHVTVVPFIATSLAVPVPLPAPIPVVPAAVALPQVSLPLPVVAVSVSITFPLTVTVSVTSILIPVSVPLPFALAVAVISRTAKAREDSGEKGIQAANNKRLEQRGGYGYRLRSLSRPLSLSLSLSLSPMLKTGEQSQKSNEAAANDTNNDTKRPGLKCKADQQHHHTCGESL